VRLLNWLYYFPRWSDWQSIAMSTSVYVSVRVSVCLPGCPWGYPPKHSRSLPIFVYIAYGRGLVLLRRRDEIPRGRDNFGDFFFTDNALYGSYSGMNFATKNWFGLNLLFTVKSDIIQVPNIKGHNFINYFEITRKLN